MSRSLHSEVIQEHRLAGLYPITFAGEEVYPRLRLPRSGHRPEHGQQNGSDVERRGGAGDAAHLIPSVLESQKSSKRARSRGGVAPPACQPRCSRSACTLKLGKCSRRGGASPMMSASDFEKLFVSAITCHFFRAGSEG